MRNYKQNSFQIVSQSQEKRSEKSIKVSQVQLGGMELIFFLILMLRKHTFANEIVECSKQNLATKEYVAINFRNSTVYASTIRIIGCSTELPYRFHRQREYI